MRLDSTIRPAYGVYAVRATVLEDDKPVPTHDGVANFGIRPMFEVPTPLLETFFFDFSGDLYGKHCRWRWSPTSAPKRSSTGSKR